MIKELRRKFVVVSVSIVLGVLVMLAVISSMANYIQIHKQSDLILDILVEHDGKFPVITNLIMKASPEIPFSTRFFTVVVGKDDVIESVDIGSVRAITKEEAIEYGNNILATEKERGFIDDYKYRVVDKEYGALMVFVDCSRELAVFRSYLFSSIPVFSISILLVFLLAMIFSKAATKSIVESYEKQRQVEPQRKMQLQKQKHRMLPMQNRLNTRSRLIQIMAIIMIVLVILIVAQIFMLKNSNIIVAKIHSNVVVDEGEIGEGNNYSEKEETITQNLNMPILVNADHKIPENYVPDIIELENDEQCERKTAEKYAQMKDDAFAAGINLWIASGYRSIERQTELFNQRVKKYENQGYAYQEAYEKTAEVIAIPGTSEHTLGYALDLNILEISFEYSKEYDWLIENCADYGFILRYPKDKVHITGITFEPWHYRYVGKEHAKIIMDNKICLEEYLLNQY